MVTTIANKSWSSNDFGGSRGRSCGSPLCSCLSRLLAIKDFSRVVHQRTSLVITTDKVRTVVGGIDLQLTSWLEYSSSLWENERLLSKITTLDLQPSRFRSSIFNGFYNSHDLTACVWSNLADFDSSLEWLQEWPGRSFVEAVDLPADLIRTRPNISGTLRRKFA